MRRYPDGTVFQDPRRGGWRAAPVLISILVLATAGPARFAPASPIRHHQAQAHAAPSRPALPAWHAFLMGGPRHWARAQPPEIGTAIHHLMNRALQSADPMGNMNVQYLVWRRSLDPARFDHWHPRVGRMIESLLIPTTVPTTTAPEALAPQQIAPETPSSSTSVVPTPVPAPSSNPAPGDVAPPANPTPSPEAIPEPETLTMALVLIGSGLWWRFRGGGPARPSQD